MALHRRDPPHLGKSIIIFLKLTITKNFIEVSYDFAKLHLMWVIFVIINIMQQTLIPVGAELGPVQPQLFPHFVRNSSTQFFLKSYVGNKTELLNAKEAIKSRLSLGMTSNNILISKHKPKHNYHPYIWDSPYLYVSMDIQIRPKYLKCFSKLFCWKNYVSKVPAIRP